MQNISVLICDLIHEDGIRALREAGFNVDVNPKISFDELKDIVSNYDVIIVRSRTKVTKEIIEAGAKLKVIARAGSGLDNIDVEAALRRGITVLNAPEAVTEAVAELTIGLMLSLARMIPYADRAIKEGGWPKEGLIGWELKGKTLGIVGFGRIGKRVAEIAKVMGMEVLVTKRSPLAPEVLKELGVELVSLQELLKRSDVITLHVPLTPETYHMIGEKEIELMKNGAFLINTSRGAIVDEEALLKALQSGKLRGAALDVYEVEPPIGRALVKLPNVVCTPHIGSQTVEAQRLVAILTAEKIVKALPSGSVAELEQMEAVHVKI